MAELLTNTTDLTKVASAIREKGGTSDSLVYPDGFVTAIGNIQTGGLKTVNFTFTCNTTEAFVTLIAISYKNDEIVTIQEDEVQPYATYTYALLPNTIIVCYSPTNNKTFHADYENCVLIGDQYVGNQQSTLVIFLVQDSPYGSLTIS